MSSKRRLALIVVSSLALPVLLGCGLTLFQPTPVVVTQEVTRVVVVTATPSPTPVVKVITVTVVVAATPTIELGEMPSPTVTVIPTEQASSEEVATATPDIQSVTPTLSEPESSIITATAYEPAIGLSALAESARAMQSQGIHTLRLTMDLSVPIELTVRDQAQVDESLTSLVRGELDSYDIHGDYIIDISVDDLAQQTWVVEALGGVAGLEGEEIVELRQKGNIIWEKPIDGEWTRRQLSEGEAALPLGNSLIAIDSYSHALNLSDLVTDAMYPLLLANHGEPLEVAQDHGWILADANPSASFLEIQRSRELTSSNNLNAIAATLANSGVSAFADPAAVANGIQRVISLEKAWLIPDVGTLDHSQVEVQGSGVVEVTYLTQQKLLDATVTLSTSNSFEYLPYTTVVTPPGQ